MYENTAQEIDNSLLVLYVLGELDIAVPETELTDLVLSPGLVNYFSFREALRGLCENGCAQEITDNGGQKLFAITEDGKVFLASSVAAFSPLLKSAYDDVLLREKNRILSETAVNAYPFIDVNKNVSVRCYIREKENKVVDLRLPVPDEDTARMICENWKKDAYGILPGLMMLLLGENG